MDIGNKIRALRESKKILQRDLAVLVGISQANLSRYESGYVVPKTDTLLKIANALMVNFSDFFPQGTVFQVSETTHKRPPNATNAPSYTPNDVPVIGLAKAGRGGFFDSHGYPPDDWPNKIHRPEDVKDHHAYAVSIEGDSMEPVLKKGHKVLAITDREAVNGDWVVVQLKSGEIMVKELIYKDDTVILKSINPLHEPIVVHKREVRAMHPVVWIKRK